MQCYDIIQLRCRNSGHLRLICVRNQVSASQVNPSMQDVARANRLSQTAVYWCDICSNIVKRAPEAPGNSFLMLITMLFHTVKIEVSHHKLYLPSLIFGTACNCCHSTLKCNTLQIIFGWNGHITIRN